MAFLGAQMVWMPARPTALAATDATPPTAPTGCQREGGQRGRRPCVGREHAVQTEG